MLTTQPANFKEITLRKIPFICIAVQSCQLPQKNPMLSALLSNPAQHPKQNSIPTAFFIQSCLTAQEKFHSTGIVIQSWQHPKENSIPLAFFVQSCVTLHEISFSHALLSNSAPSPFHLPCNLILLYILRKIFHSTCLVI